GWFCRADVHATIDLLRVRVDNFAADFLGQLQGDFALSHRRGPENDNKLGLHRRWKNGECELNGVPKRSDPLEHSFKFVATQFDQNRTAVWTLGGEIHVI